MIVEDIVDTGKSAVAVTEAIKKQQPASVRFATLLIKKTEKRNNFRPDCEHLSFEISFFFSSDLHFFPHPGLSDIGFAIPDSFVVGYALDYNEYFRDLDVSFF